MHACCLCRPEMLSIRFTVWLSSSYCPCVMLISHLCSGDHIIFLSQDVDQLALALVAPLCSKHNTDPWVEGGLYCWRCTRRLRTSVAVI